VSYGLSVVRFVRLPGLEGSQLGELLEVASRRQRREHGTSPDGALWRNLHLTLLPVLRSRFALPEDRGQAEACLAELAELVRDAPEDGELRRDVTRLQEAAATDHRHLRALLERKWQSALSFFREPGRPSPHTGDLTHPLASFDLELAPSGHLILLVPDVLGDREWAQRVSEACGGRLPAPEGTLHVTLLHVGSHHAYEWLERRLNEPLAGGGPIWLGKPYLVSYQHRTLEGMIRTEALYAAPVAKEA
jgi:hypothetical protein